MNRAERINLMLDLLDLIRVKKQPLTLREIATVTGMSFERVRQIEAGAIAKIRKEAKRRLGLKAVA